MHLTDAHTARRHLTLVVGGLLSLATHHLFITAAPPSPGSVLLFPPYKPKTRCNLLRLRLTPPAISLLVSVARHRLSSDLRDAAVVARPEEVQVQGLQAQGRRQEPRRGGRLRRLLAAQLRRHRLPASLRPALEAQAARPRHAGAAPG